MSSRHVLEMRSVARSFGPRSSRAVAVDDLSLDIAAGEVLCLLGPNGAGKTTSVKMAATLLRPSSGQINVCGVDAVASPRKARGKIGLVLGGDRGFYLRATARENLDFFGELQGVSSRGHRRSAAALEAVGLSHAATKRVETFSRGMKQRLHVARALMSEPALILLDEPSLGLDPEGAQQLRRLVLDLRDQGRGILLTTHYLDEADELLDRLAVVVDGRIIAAGSSDQISQLAGVSTVTTVTIDGLSDPESALVSLSPESTVTTFRRNGLWFAEIAWADRPVPASAIEAVIESDVVTSVSQRPASLEEAYLSFLRRHRATMSAAASA